MIYINIIFIDLFGNNYNSVVFFMAVVVYLRAQFENVKFL